MPTTSRSRQIRAMTLPTWRWLPACPAYSPSARLTYDGDGLAAVRHLLLARPRRGEGERGGQLGRCRCRPTGSRRASRSPPQSRWHGVANPANRVLIATDPPGDTADAAYDLTTLYAAQTADHWHFGFHVAAAPPTMCSIWTSITEASSGGTADPLSYPVVTMEAHRPEYVIQIGNDGAAPVATQTWILPLDSGLFLGYPPEPGHPGRHSPTWLATWSSRSPTPPLAWRNAPTAPPWRSTAPRPRAAPSRIPCRPLRTSRS